ncbi:MAG: hypothetical protein ACOYJ2_08975, partial [Rickettsiales bacterium]
SEYRNIKILLEQHLGSLLCDSTEIISDDEDNIVGLTINCQSRESQKAIAAAIVTAGNQMLTIGSLANDDIPMITAPGRSFQIRIEGETAERFMLAVLQHIHMPDLGASTALEGDGTTVVAANMGWQAVYELIKQIKMSQMEAGSER